MKSKVSKRGIVLLSLSIIVIVILFIPNQNLADNSPAITTDFNLQDADDTIPFDIDDDQAIIDSLFLNSIIDTDLIITTSDQSQLEQFLDESGVGLTEKFGIVTNVAFVDGDNQVSTSSSILGVSSLSVADNSGALLDLLPIQITMQGITKNTESNINLYGTVEFFIDDNLIPDGTKQFWASGQNTNNLDLSLVNHLSFKNDDFNAGVDTQIDSWNGKRDLLNSMSSGQLRDTANLLGLSTTSSVSIIADTIALKILELQDSKRTTQKQALAPSFNEQAKKNFTFGFSDENLTDGEHTFRVVITEVHANIESDQDYKQFHFTGQNIAYELKIDVDGTQKVILDENNNAVEILKSDNTIKLCTDYNNYVTNAGYGSLRRNHISSTDVPDVTVRTISGDLIVDAKHESQGSKSCTTITGIPRDSSIIFTVDGVDYPVDTPKSQVNYIIGVELVKTGFQGGCQQFLGGRSFSCSYPIYSDSPYSNFGFGRAI